MAVLVGMEVLDGSRATAGRRGRTAGAPGRRDLDLLMGLCGIWSARAAGRSSWTAYGGRAGSLDGGAPGRRAELLDGGPTEGGAHGRRAELLDGRPMAGGRSPAPSGGERRTRDGWK
uniref:Uncharacterized protein n=1 Tax=Arundo donax TaxID=35708 RepID=A0A0A9MUA5_ARUDO